MIATFTFLMGFACAIIMVKLGLRGIRIKAAREQNRTREWAAIIIEHHLFGS